MKNFIFSVLNAWVVHRAASKGAALAFYTLFSLIPVLALTIAVAGHLVGAEAAQNQIIAQLQDLIGTNGAELIRQSLAAARTPTTSFTAAILATILSLIGGTAVFIELKSSLDEIWQVEPSASPSAFWSVIKMRLLAFGLMFALGFLLLASLVINAALSALEHYAGGIFNNVGVILTVLSTLSSFAIAACLFAVIYKMLPNVPLTWKDIRVGAVATAVLFILGKYAIGLYLGKTNPGQEFGAAGPLMVLLLWVYYSAQIFFLGAEFTRQYALSGGSLRYRNAGIVNP